MDISVVIPLFNEEESLPELYAWIERVMQANGFSFEVIFVNDGSTDHSWEVIEKLKAQSEHVKGIKFRRNYGKSPALYCGFAEAEGNVVITMDADLQDSPDEIPELYRMITKDGYDLVSGWKQKRYDPISKTLPTKLFNATARKVSGIKNLHDFNCGLKAYRKEVVKHIEVYGEMHRYIPYLVSGFTLSLVPFQIRHQADAFLRTVGIIDVSDRNDFCHHRRCQQTICHVQRSPLPTGDRLSLFLFVTYGNDYRYAIILSRIPWRTHLAQCTGTE